MPAPRNSGVSNTPVFTGGPAIEGSQPPVEALRLLGDPLPTTGHQQRATVGCPDGIVGYFEVREDADRSPSREGHDIDA